MQSSLQRESAICRKACSANLLLSSGNLLAIRDRKSVTSFRQRELAAALAGAHLWATNAAVVSQSGRNGDPKSEHGVAAYVEGEPHSLTRFRRYFSSLAYTGRLPGVPEGTSFRIRRKR